MTEIAKGKEQIAKQWNNRPCGQVGDLTYDLDYFERVEENRYTNYGPWMKPFYRYDDPAWKGKKFLEIGYGQGTDMVQYIKSGAECYGIDYTPNHVELAKLNLKLRGLEANLIQGDASNLPYKDNYFDKIASFGVLHHTPDTQKCFDEAHRVLKPGGVFMLSLYHRNSFFYYYVKLFVEGILKLKLLKLGYKGLMATVEEGADGKNIKPVVKVYSRRQLGKMLRKFSSVKFHIRHLKANHTPKISDQSRLDRLEKKYGWYIIAEAVK
jgi:ubiquinone/menaquinone biosynthesis C-methylase UbiE